MKKFLAKLGGVDVQLISAAPSPFARKVRVALLEKSIPFELITVNPWNSAAKVQIHNP